MQYLGIDWGTRRAAWCALDEHGSLREGMVSADEGGWVGWRLRLPARRCAGVSR